MFGLERKLQLFRSLKAKMLLSLEQVESVLLIFNGQLSDIQQQKSELEAEQKVQSIEQFPNDSYSVLSLSSLFAHRQICEQFLDILDEKYAVLKVKHSEIFSHWLLLRSRSKLLDERIENLARLIRRVSDCREEEEVETRCAWKYVV